MIDHSDLPKLQSIWLGFYALEGNDRDNNKTINEEPYNYKNTLSMKSNHSLIFTHQSDLPNLTIFIGTCNFKNVGSVILESSFSTFFQFRYP